MVASCACFALRRAARALTQHYDRALRPSGMRITQFTLLALVRARGPVAIHELAAATASDPATLSRNLALLRRRGWIRITSRKQDRRERRVHVTAAGGRALAVALAPWRSAQAQVRSTLGATRVRRLASDLAILVEARRS